MPRQSETLSAQGIRPENDEDRYGEPGRIQRPSHRYIPGAKKWYTGYNIKTEDEPLIEDLPVGLRRKRLACVVITVVLVAIMAIVTLALAIWACRVFDVDIRGPEAVVFEKSSIGFLKPVEVRGPIFLKDVSRVVRSWSGEALNFMSPHNIKLVSFSRTPSQISTLELEREHVLINSPQINIVPTDEEDPVVRFDPEQIVFQARDTSFVGSVRTEENSKVTANVITTSVADNLVVDSTEQLRVSAFTDVSMSSRLGDVRIAGQDVTLATGTLFGTSVDLQTPLFLDVAELPSTTATPEAAYTLCSCPDGRIYRTSASTRCAPGDAAAVCT